MEAALRRISILSKGINMPRRRRRDQNILTLGIPSLNETHRNKLVQLLQEVLDESPTLQDLKTSITFDKIANTGEIQPVGRLVFRDESANGADIIYNHEYGHSSVRFVEFSPRDISSRTLYQSTGQSEHSAQNFWSNVYSTYWQDRLTSRRFGVNVLKRMSVKGYILNFNDVRKLIDESLITRRYDKILDYINEFYYFSKRNCLLGLATTNGILLIRLQAIKKILEENDDATVKRCLRNLLVCYSKLLARFIELNVREVHTETAEIVKQSVINKIVNGDGYSRRLYRYVAEGEDKEEFKKQIEDYITLSLQKAYDGSVFGATDQYSYANILNKIIGSRRNQEKLVFKEGFAKGMKIGLKFEMIGWAPSNPKFADDSDTAGMWWEKVVNIKPNSFVYKSKRYVIPESERQFKVTKLYINQDGSMRADAKHPNVSGSSVCMGDLAVDFSGETSDIQEILIRVEELLDMINYDSAYNSEALEHLLEVSEVQESLYSGSDESIRDKVRKASTIRELGSDFDDSDDEEDGEEEEISDEESEVIHISDNNGSLIAEITSLGDPVEPEEDDDASYYDDYGVSNLTVSDSDMVDHIENQEVVGSLEYDAEETLVVNDLHTVNNEGEQRQVVFNIPLSPVPVGGFALGDSNLVEGSS